MWHPYHDDHGPVLEVVIDTLAIAKDLFRDPGIGPPAPPVKGFAIIDTGATHTCVDRRVALTLKLPEVGVRVFSSVSSHGRGEPHYTSCRFAVLTFPSISKQAEMEVMCIDSLGKETGRMRPVMLLGRDFLAAYDILFEGRNRRFRIVPPTS